MKKILLFAAVCAITATSCTQQKHQTQVTVIGKATDFKSKATSTMLSIERYSVVTPSGDTVIADVPEHLAVSKATPYQATMETTDGAGGYPQITE